MTRVVVLDTGPLGLVTHPRAGHHRGVAPGRRALGPTAHEHALDGDVILAAQASLLSEDGANDVVVATTNVAHLSRFVSAKGWQEIGP